VNRQKIIHSEQVEKTRSKLMKLSGAAYQRLKRQNGKSWHIRSLHMHIRKQKI